MSEHDSNNDLSPDQSLRNAVFAAKAAAEGGGRNNVPTQQTFHNASAATAASMAPQIAVDVVPLPTKGSVYPQGHPLCGAESVEYRSMTTREEDILTSAALIKKGTVINELIKSCLIKKDIDVTSLLSGDRNALMLAIRASGYGAIYRPSMTCPSCETKQEVTVNLGDLAIKHLDIAPVVPGENLFQFQLPVSKNTVTFKFLTGQDEEEIIAQANMKKKKGFQLSNLITSRLLSSIVAINGNRDRNLVADHIGKMPALDSSELRSYIDEHEPGVDMSLDFVCSNCEHYEEVAIPMDASFFWPNSKRQGKRNS